MACFDSHISVLAFHLLVSAACAKDAKYTFLFVFPICQMDFASAYQDVFARKDFMRMFFADAEVICS